MNRLQIEHGRPSGKPKSLFLSILDRCYRASISTWVIPDLCHRESIWSFFSDGAPLTTGGDDGKRSVMRDSVYRASILAFPGWIPADEVQGCGGSHPIVILSQRAKDLCPG